MILNVVDRIREVKFSGIQGLFESAFLPNWSVISWSWFADIHKHEFVVGVYKGKKHNTECAFVIEEKAARVVERLDLDVLPIQRA